MVYKALKRLQHDFRILPWAEIPVGTVSSFLRCIILRFPSAMDRSNQTLQTTQWFLPYWVVSLPHAGIFIMPGSLASQYYTPVPTTKTSILSIIDPGDHNFWMFVHISACFTKRFLEMRFVVEGVRRPCICHYATLHDFNILQLESDSKILQEHPEASTN